MVFSTGYAKPNMTNLPADLGKAIFEQMLKTPKADDEKLLAEAEALEKEMVKIRKLKYLKK